MIGRLTGTILAKQTPFLLLDVHGVGYEIEASLQTFYQCPDVGQMVTLHTHFVVREDAQLLFGFYEWRERELFRQLIKVNGVGPKLALTVLSSIEPDEFVRCISESDSNRLVRLPGVGKKTAERLVIEMRDRLSDWQVGEESLNDNSAQFKMTMGFMNDKIPAQEAISALLALGYKAPEAQKVVNRVVLPEMSSEEIIRQALKQMVR